MGKQEAKLIFGLQRLGLTFWRGEKSKEEDEEEEEGEGEEVQKNSGMCWPWNHGYLDY